MKTSFFNTRVLRMLGLGIGVLIISFIVHTALSEDSDVVETATKKSQTLYVPESTSVLPYGVSGIVESSHSVVVRAETAGVIQSLHIVEGSVVGQGETVLTQHTPVLESQIALGQAQGVLASLMQNSSLIQGAGAAHTTSVLVDSANTARALTETRNAVNVEDATKLLATQLQTSLIELVAALDFIDTKRSYFPKESAKLYNETVSALYGTQPSFLSNSIIYRVSSHDDMLEIFQSLKEAEHMDTQKLLELSRLVDTEIGTASTMFFNAEHDFFDEKLIEVNSEIYTTYLNHRRALVGGASGLEAAIATLQTAQNNGALSLHGEDTQVSLGEINYRTAQDALKNTGAIFDQTNNVSERQLDVLYAQRSLGAPSAPFTGVVSEIYVEDGEYVTPGTPLMKIVGSGARELEVRVPASMLPFLKEGLPFVVSGETKGFVSRFAGVLTEGSVAVFIELTGASSLVGGSMEGDILFDIDSTLLTMIPRSYVFFNGNGSYVRTESGSAVPVVIVYDTGEMLYIRSSSALVTNLLPAVGIAF